jgi:hypothetical protein
MSDTGTVVTPAPVEMPVPFGVLAETGNTHPPLTQEDLDRITGDRDEVKARASDEGHLAVVPTVNAMDLADAGWGIIFAADADPAVKKALEPLIEHRRKQATGPARFKVFENNKGVRRGQQATDWLDRQGVGLAVVDPDNGVPYYLLLVGSPQQIPFEFQYTLDLQWCVGRLHFDTPGEYEAYARAVVEYETAVAVPHRKRAAMWMPQNRGDAATTMLLNQVGRPFMQSGLGKKKGFQLQSFVDADATKARLTDIMRGVATEGPPALLFTGSHGLEWPKSDLAGQRAQQGALVSQEWAPGQGVGAHARFGGDDIPADAKLLGMVHFLFACFGGGCPVTDTYRTAADGSAIALADEPMMARLPQRMLSSGALAVMAHVDRAWSWSFQTGSGLPQNQVMKSTMDAVLAGLRVGMALDFFNLQWSTLAARLGMLQGQRVAGLPPSPASLANLFVARDDARNYVLFGDPAVRLRVEDMAA